MNKPFWTRATAVMQGAGLASLLVLAGCSTAPAVQTERNDSAVASKPPTRIQWIDPTSDHAPSIDITYKNAHPPRYPKLAIVQHHQGVVVLDVTIDADGRVVNVSVEHSSGYQELDESAALAADGWKYGPGVRHGKTFGGIVRVPITFHF